MNGTVDTAEEILGEDGETVVKNPYYGMSIVRFEDFIITQPGTQTFQIKEVIGGEEDIEYDTHVETVTIQAVDNGDGTLKCTAVYDNDGPVFTNSRIPVFDEAAGGGRLLIKKVVSNMTTSQSFPFTVTLFDKNGTELTGQAFKCDTVATGNEDAYLTTEEMTVSAVSHTQNLDDLGEKQSDYGNGWNNSSIRGTGRDSASNEAHVVTIPGAEELSVSIVYGGENAGRDWACAWQGAHSTYTADDNYSTSFTGKLGGGDHTAESNTKTYTVPGDTVTFAYRSDGEGCGDGYGYYAVVTADVTVDDYNEKCLQQSEITSGQTIDISSGHTAIIRGLPDGVRYAVEEGEVAGFELVDTENGEGSIAWDSDSTAVFTNVYNGRGQAQIRMRKTFEGGELEEGKFTFRLADDSGDTIEEVTNGADGSIVFSPMDFDQNDIGQRYSYTVTETPGDDPDVMYDSHSEEVIIDIRDSGDGNINAEIRYMGDAEFVNSPAASSVTVKKTVRGNMGSRDKQFDFTAVLKNADDTPYSKDVTFTKGEDTGTLTPDSDGVISFTLAHGEEITLSDISFGTKYTIGESGVEADGYTVAKTNDTGTIASENPDVSFVNTKGGTVPEGVEASFPWMLGAAAAGLGAYLFYKKKRRDAEK